MYNLVENATQHKLPVRYFTELLAEALGVKVAAALPEGQRFDKVVESAGNPATLQIALESVRANGTVLVVSVFEENITIDANLLVCSQITLIGCNCYDREDLETAADLIASRRVDVSPIITDIFPVEEGKAAFEKLCAREKQAAKILLQP
jgi:threonine dehydrogenase-like Zn-dependent dehydrogenase